MPVLIVDDDDAVLIALKVLLKSEGVASFACRSPKEAVAAVRREAFQLALVDLNFLDDTTSGTEGLALIKALREIDVDLPIIAMTAWGTIGQAVEAMRLGASDFVEKPWDDNNRLLASINTQVKLRAALTKGKRLSAENAMLREQIEETSPICVSQAMSELLELSRRVAASHIPILITGENGTGKNVLANYIHRHSPYAQGPFVSVNMGAISETTFESEMFGHTRGAYTDAKSDRMGRAELADQGTLFMDEIANMPLTQQAKILRLAEEKAFERLGSSLTKRINVRLISATNADLDSLVAEGNFRQDLLYRLNGIALNIPALRERKEDIMPLAENFLGRTRSGCHSSARVFSPCARRALESYAWPGNIREMQHVVERAALLASGDTVWERDLQLAASGSPVSKCVEMTMDQAELWMVKQAMQRHNGNANEAARALGISRSALYRKLGKRSAG